ncbi:hypothetical protein CBF45_07615 [Bordetella sp. J329]|nr:hypothetical protein CBF45_07615 [Bordetella sp. J329]
MRIEWVRPQYFPDDLILLELNTQRLAEAIRTYDPDGVVCPGSATHPTLEDRYERIGEKLSYGGEMDAIGIGLSPEGHVTIADGRHRLAWCIQNKVEKIGAVVAPGEAGEILKLFA